MGSSYSSTRAAIVREASLLIDRFPLVLRASVRSLLARAAVTPVVAVLSVGTAAIAVRELGASGYGLYSIIIGLAIILPFSDLGIGAAIMDATARAKVLPDDIVGVAKRSLIVLSAVSVALMLIGWVAVPFGLWSVLLAGGQGEIDLACAVALTIFSVSLPLSLGTRVLTGLGLNHLTIFFQALSPALAFVFTAGLYAAGMGSIFLSSAPFLGIVCSNFVATLMAFRRLNLRLTMIWRSGFRRSPSTRISTVAVPMLIITMALPVAYQFDRYLLAHYSTLQEVAQYALAYQLFAPLVGFVSSAATALWPAFIKHSGDGRPGKPLITAVLFFLVLGILAASALIGFGRPLSALVSGGVVVLRIDVLVAFGLFLVLQSVSYPFATFLTAPYELRVQSFWHVVMAIVNVLLSVLGASYFGAPGPIGASFVSVLLLLFIPQIVLFKSRGKRSQLG